MTEETEGRILYDTSALIEFFSASEQGQQVKEFYLDEKVENLIPSIVFTELVGKLRRLKKDPSMFVSFLEENSTVLELDLQTAKKAGEVYANLKLKEPNISSIDCIIMAHGDMTNGKIITKDHHFKSYKRVVILE